MKKPVVNNPSIARAYWGSLRAELFEDGQLVLEAPKDSKRSRKHAKVRLTPGMTRTILAMLDANVIPKPVQQVEILTKVVE